MDYRTICISLIGTVDTINAEEKRVTGEEERAFWVELSKDRRPGVD